MRTGIFPVLLLCVVAVLTGTVRLVGGQQLVQIPSSRQGFLNSGGYTDQVTSNQPIIYQYYRQPGSDGALQLTIESITATESQPIIIIVKRRGGVQSWQLPAVVDDRYVYDTITRILCPSSDLVENDGTIDNGQLEMIIEVLTVSSQPIAFNLRVNTFTDFEVFGPKTLTLTATPSAPVYIRYRMRRDSTRALVKLRSISANSTCTFLSVQAARCPVSDLEDSMRLSGRFQTVTTQGAIEVSRAMFPEEMFFIAVIVKPDDHQCESTQGPLAGLRPRVKVSMVSGRMRSKTVSISITDNLEPSQVAVPIVVPIIVFLVFSVVTLILLQTSCRNWKAVLCNDPASVVLPARSEQWRITRLGEFSVRCKRVPAMWDPSKYTVENGQGLRRTPAIRITTHPNDPNRQSGIEPMILSGKSVKADKGPKRGESLRRNIEEVSTTSSSQLKGISREYSFTLIAVFIFYSLPVIQLVMTHQALLFVTGNEDICFYNFSCANRVGLLSDFNHIISNMGYVILGLLFLIIVRRRSIYTRKLRSLVEQYEEYGIAPQFGIFYGMGLALVMEGVMSACYHVCPSYNNFQFDTSFMYLLSGLLLLKVYQSRHPDVLPKSYNAYAFFAIFIFMAVVGVVTKNVTYWIVLSSVHGLIAVIAGFEILYVGTVEISPKKCYQAARSTRLLARGENAVPISRIILSTMIILVNVAFAITGPLLRKTDFASHLLFVLQANLLIYASFYMGKKVSSSREKITWVTFLYFGLAVVAWLVGMYFFTRGLTNWEVSPARSREGNKECFFFYFYDEHDVWHMCSAFGLFLTFMMLLSLDDDQATIPRSKIEVF